MFAFGLGLVFCGWSGLMKMIGGMIFGRSGMEVRSSGERCVGVRGGCLEGGWGGERSKGQGWRVVGGGEDGG